MARGRLDAVTSISHCFHRFVIDENGQEVIEYALLVGLVALVTIPALAGPRGIPAALRAAYQSWNAAMLKCWRMPAPGTGGGC